MMNTKQFFVVLFILLGTLMVAVPAYIFVPPAKEEIQVSKLPMQISEWQGKDLPIEERAYEILETRNLILREYSKGNDKVYLYIIYSQDNRKVSHPPEVCFEGSGVTIVKKAKILMELADNRRISANELIVERAGVSNIVVYWYKAGEYYTDNYLKQQLKIALNRLRFKRTSGALIRLSAEVSPANPSHTLESIKAFTKEASAYFKEIIP